VLLRESGRKPVNQQAPKVGGWKMRRWTVL
jgi:hypothetical protein